LGRTWDGPNQERGKGREKYALSKRGTNSSSKPGNGCRETHRYKRSLQKKIFLGRAPWGEKESTRRVSTHKMLKKGTTDRIAAHVMGEKKEQKRNDSYKEKRMGTPSVGLQDPEYAK